MKVILFSVSVPDTCLPDEVAFVIHRALVSSFEDCFVRTLEAVRAYGILEHRAHVESEEPVQRKKKAS